MTHSTSPFGPGGPVAGRAPPPPATPPGGAERLFGASAIGQALGARSQKSFDNDLALNARSQGITALTHALQADQEKSGGRNTQRVLLDFFTSKDGMEALNADPDFPAEVTRIVQPFLPTAATRTFRAEAQRSGKTPEELQAQNDAEDEATVARADTALEQGAAGLTLRRASLAVAEQNLTIRRLEFNQGTDKEQNEVALAAALRMPVEELRARNDAERGTPKEAATRRLVANGTISAGSRDLMIAGMFFWSEIRGGLTGTEPTGRWQMFRVNPDDLSMIVSTQTITVDDPQITDDLRLTARGAPPPGTVEPGAGLVPSTAGAGGLSATPGAPAQPTFTGAVPAPATAPPTPFNPDSPFAGMEQITAAAARAGGVIGVFRRIINIAGGQFFENLSDDEISAWSAMLRDIRQRYQAVIASDAAGRLAAPEREKALKNVEMLGINTSGRDNLVKMFRLRKTLEQMIVNTQLIQADSEGRFSTPATRKEAASREDTLREGLSFLPSIDDLKAERIKMAEEDDFGGLFDFMNRTFDTIEEDLGRVPPIGPDDPESGDPPLQEDGTPVAPSRLDTILSVPLPVTERANVVVPPAQVPGAQKLVALVPFNEIDAAAMAAIDDPGIFEQFGNYLATADENIEFIIPPEFRAPMEALKGVGVGMNKTLAVITGLSVEVMNDVMVTLFNNGFLDNPGEGEEAINTALRDMGVFKRPEISSLAEEFGQNMFIALVSAGVMVASAPGIAGAAAIRVGQVAVNQAIVTGGVVSRGMAALGSGARQLFVDMARFSRDNPVRFLFGEITAVAGLTAGGEIARARKLGPGATMLLELTGGIFGAGLFGILSFASTKSFTQTKNVLGTTVEAESILRTGAARVGRVVEKVITGIASPFKFAKGFSEEAISNAASASLARERYAANFAIRAAIGRFTPKILNNNVAEARKFVIAIKELYKKAQNQASLLWDGDPSKGTPGVPTNTNMTGQNKELVRFINEEIDVNMPVSKISRAGEIPVELVDDIKALVIKTPKGTVTLKTTYIDYRGFRRQIRTLLENPITTPTQRRALVKIDEKLMDLIIKASPDPGMHKRALEYTRWLHQRFTRGPFQEIISGREKLLEAGNVVPVARTAIRAERGPEFLADIAATLGDPQGRIAAENLIRSQMRRDIDVLMETAARKVEIAGGSQIEMDLAAAQAGGRKLIGSEMLADPELQAFLKAFPKVAAKVQHTQKALTAALKDARRIETSALKLFTDLSPDDAITKLLKLPNGPDNRQLERAAQIMVDNVRNDPDALASLRFALLKRFTGTATGDVRDPVISLQELTSKSNITLLRIVFGDEGYRRMRNILLAGRDLSSGGTSLFRFYVPTADLVGRFSGAGASRLVGGRTIQQAQVGANIGKNFLLKMASNLDPLAMMARAFRDPQMEAFLLSRAPVTNQEFLVMERKLQFLLNSIIADTHLLTLPSEKR